VTIRLHKSAVLARLRIPPGMSERVFEGRVPSRTEAYAALYTNTGFYPRDRFTGPQGGTVTYTYWLHSIGSTPDQAQAIAEQILTQLLNWKPVVDGYLCSRMVHRVSQPIQLDDVVRPPLFVGVDQFDLTSNPL
jgi:hypothetical protein